MRGSNTGVISTDGNKGGAIITDSYFSRNTASGKYGGGVYADSPVLATTTSVRCNSPDNCEPDVSVSGCIG
jgi:predicted outer membrane repeat protein